VTTAAHSFDVDAALDASGPSGLLVPPSSGLRSVASALLEGRTDYAEKNLRLLAADPTVDPAWRSIIEGRLMLALGRTADAGFRFAHAAALAFCDAFGLPGCADASPGDADGPQAGTDASQARACVTAPAGASGELRTSARADEAGVASKPAEYPEFSALKSLESSARPRHLRVAACAINFLGDACRRSDRPDEAVGHHLRAYTLWSRVGSRVERALAASNVGLDHDILDEPAAAVRWHEAATGLVRLPDDGGWDATPLAWATPPNLAEAGAPPTVTALLLARQRDTLARFARFDEALAVGQALCDHVTSLRPGGVEVLRCRLRRCDILRRKAERAERDDPAAARDLLHHCRSELLDLVEEFGAFGVRTQREQLESDEQLEFVERLLGVTELDGPHEFSTK